MPKNNNISIIDYKVGNLLSVKRSLEISGAKATITSDSEKILSSSSVVLPGVGAFKRAMNLIKDHNLEDIIYKVIERKIPLLGICLGMQLLFDESYEFGKEKGGRDELFPQSTRFIDLFIRWPGEPRPGEPRRRCLPPTLRLPYQARSTFPS